jgi:hypothetical protein
MKTTALNKQQTKPDDSLASEHNPEIALFDC